MQQMFVVIIVSYMCIRCLACGVQGQVRECASGEPRCFDVALHVQVEQQAAPTVPERGSRRDTYDRPEPRSWDEETWQLGQRRELRAPAPHLLRKRPRSLQLASSYKREAAWDPRF